MPDLEAAIRSEATAAKRDPALLAMFEALRLNLGTADTEIALLLDPGLWQSIEGDAPCDVPGVWGSTSVQVQHNLPLLPSGLKPVPFELSQHSRVSHLTWNVSRRLTSCEVTNRQAAHCHFISRGFITFRRPSFDPGTPTFRKVYRARKTC